jgi:hypothetical protein
VQAGGVVTTTLERYTAVREIAALRADRDHVLAVARQAADAAAHERDLRMRITNRLSAAGIYVQTLQCLSGRQRRELLALLYGHRDAD